MLNLKKFTPKRWLLEPYSLRTLRFEVPRTKNLLLIPDLKT